MSLVQYGAVGGYTNATYPPPPCGFFDWTVNGNSIEFGDFQSRVCISNKIIIALTITNCIASGATWAFGAYLTVREFSLVREWNDTKSFCVFYFVGAIGAALFAVNDIVGSPLWNSIGWYLATIGVCAMEAFTVLLWARVTLKIIHLKKSETDRSKELMRWLSRIMVGLTTFVCVALLPVFVLRAAWYDFKNPWWYNFLMWLYHVVMLPWFPLFATTVIVFGFKLSKLLNETMDAFDNSSSKQTASGNGVLGTANYSQTNRVSTYAQVRADSRKTKFQSAIRKIKIVSILVCVDKLGFLLSYTTFAIYGGMTMYEPKSGMGAYFSFYAMNCLIIFWGNGLLLGCGWYHLRRDRSDDSKPDKVTGSTHSEGGQFSALDYADGGRMAAISATANPLGNAFQQKVKVQEMAYYSDQTFPDSQASNQYRSNGFGTQFSLPPNSTFGSNAQQGGNYGSATDYALWNQGMASQTQLQQVQPSQKELWVRQQLEQQRLGQFQKQSRYPY
ncbi:hypothetical protein BJ742DRAFT_358283 [Cladochytrium replicatum]|nr:hypothetical protein BJ742DRAFT_358283 [Cladochytrium replicatum]